MTTTKATDSTAPAESISNAPTRKLRLTFKNVGRGRNDRYNINSGGKLIGQITRTHYVQRGFYLWIRIGDRLLNTAGKPRMTLEEAKAAAKDFVE